jgi:hypothetical protein
LGPDLESWATWISVLKAAHGEPLSPAELTLFLQAAGGRNPPRRKVRELIGNVSRRSGKGRAAAAVAVHSTLLTPHGFLAPGEVGVAACISPTRAQAAIVRDYCEGFIVSSAVLRGELLDTTADEIRLRNGTVICTLSVDYRSLRGRTLLSATLDEAAFLRDERSATPDREAIRALQPGLSTSGGLLCILSSPYRKAGVLYERVRDYFGKDDPNVLCVSGPSELFNPLVDRGAIAAAMTMDPEAARSEWCGEFRNDVSGYLDDDAISAAVDHNRPLELPPRGFKYSTYADSSGGRGDAYTAAVGHEQDGRYVIDVVRGWAPPFDPQQVTGEVAALAMQYGCRKIVGDNYAAEWVATAFRGFGLTYERSDLPASGQYIESLPLFMQGRVSMPNHPRLLTELRQLERRTSKIGKDQVTHPANGSDDYSNAVCGLLRLLAAPAKGEVLTGFYGYGGPVQWNHEKPARRSWRRGGGISAVDGQPTVTPESKPFWLHRN